MAHMRYVRLFALLMEYDGRPDHGERYLCELDDYCACYLALSYLAPSEVHARAAAAAPP